jgi:hypothetical protein
MATANNIVTITELDFDQIKNNFKLFLQGQDTFSDYNFEGSGLSVLLDVLSYNTHYGAYFLNMLANEMHISTAQLRDNIVKLAKSLNYVPASATAATAGIKLTVTPPDSNSAPSVLVMPRYTSFISQAVNGVNYNFVTTTAYSTTFDGTSYVFDNVNISEGDVINYTYNVIGTNRVSFNIPNANIDTSTLIVNVTETSTTQSTTAPYVLCKDISLLDGNSRVFFLEGSDNSTYNIYFGDGILGKKPSNGDSVNLIYLNTHGDASNYANNFSITTSINGYSNVISQSVFAAAGGGVIESNENIKYNAPLAYSTQNRAVTVNDYKYLLKRDYQNIGSISVWGGDQNDPPIYGKIFISIKPKFGNYLSTLEKQKILNILTQYNMITVDPVMVDPDYTYVLFNVTVNYNPNLTTATTNQMISTIRNSVINYSNSQLSKFDATFRESSLVQNIMASDPSILGADAGIYLQKRFFPILNNTATYTLKFNTVIKQGGLFEKLYTTPGVSIYDNTGILRNCFIEENVNSYQGITQINVTSPGFSYTDIPTISITGDGVGATAHAVIVNGSINSIVLDNPGEGYSFATVTVSGGGGYGATLVPILQSSTGVLQTYYIDSSNKFFITTNQGTVDHLKGVVTLSNFTPIDVANPSKVMNMNVKPESNFIIPAQNNILILDPTDPVSIQITLIPQIT